MRRLYKTRSQRGSGIAEFAPALFLFFFLGLFPLLDLLALAWGESSITIIATQCASRAAGSGDYTTALSSATQEAASLATSGFGKFAKVTPVGGNSNSGLNLYVNATAIGSRQVTQYGPNTAVPPPIDSTNNIYEYAAQVSYDLAPFLPLGAVPFVGQVPGLGVPARLTATVNRAVEFPDGLLGAGAIGGGSGGGGSGQGADSSSGGGTASPGGGSTGSGTSGGSTGGSGSGGASGGPVGTGGGSTGSGPSDPVSGPVGTGGGTGTAGPPGLGGGGQQGANQGAGPPVSGSGTFP